MRSIVSAQTKPAADLIIRNAKIWTVDRDHPEAEAVAILGDRIVAVGSNQDVDAWRGAEHAIVDAAGKRLLPGFNDAHVHFCRGGSQLDNVQLNDATSPQEFVRRIAERAAKTAQRRMDGGRRLGRNEMDARRSYRPRN